ncbi:hypothetical protein [Halomonas sp. QHL1]|uniref:hypothetical protein n=1 Tax=Halomonas sp. QHL1 TaxID=1123773 RepID=UPI0008FD6A92|nr:hypothetical protein [Halomonas sp. QHL1]OJA07240.1 hypothetical protein QHL1GM_18510 [Halomonas sp. QHL1]
MDLNFTQHGEKIISVKEAIKHLGFKLDVLASAASETYSSLIVIPPNKIFLAIRYPKDYQRGIFDRQKKDSLSLNLEKINGFITSPEDIEKTLHSLNWSTSKPIKAVRTDPKSNSAIISTPYSMAHEEKFHQKKIQHGDSSLLDLIRSYKNQEFYFKKGALKNTKITLNNCFFIESEIQKIKSHIYASLEPNFEDISDYQINEWSNSLIIDINAIYHHLQKDSIKEIISSKTTNSDKKKIITAWFGERWAGRKGVTKASLDQAHKIVGNENVKINLNTLGVTGEDIKRNQAGAPDILILIDVAAERRNKKIQDYLGSDKFHDELIKAGVEPGDLRQAIYSIIKGK